MSAPSPTVNRGLRNQIIGNRIYHNDRVGEPDPQADGGNLKATGQDNLVMDGNEVYDSGKGLWLDVWCRNSIYRNNRIHDNDGPGIHDETSTGSKIYNNVIWHNGAAEGPGAGGRASSSPPRRPPRSTATPWPGTRSASASSARTAPMTRA